MFEYQEELEFAKKLIVEVSHILEQPFNTRDKSARDVVTSNDLAIEKALVTAIKDKYPEDAIVAEETQQTVVQDPRVWVFDPIDGTTNYSRGIPLYGIQIAFVVDGKARFSLLYYVPFKELYVAVRDRGATCNGEPIHVGENETLDQAIITLGDFSTNNEVRNTRMITFMREMMDQVYKLRIHSTACIDLLFLASGKTDVHLMSANHVWDYLPGLLLVHEAGGIVDQDLIDHFGGKRTLMVVGSTLSLTQKVKAYI